MAFPCLRIPPSKESCAPPDGNPKTQEIPHPHPAFLQNRLLAQVKSQRSINRFRILHGRLTDTGESIDMYGPEPLGFLILTAEGRFMVIETVRDRQPPPQTPSGFRTQVRSVPNPRGCRRGVAAGDHTVIASDIHDYGFPLDF